MAHKSGVVRLAASSDGKFLATGGYDRNVKLWDDTGKEIAENQTFVSIADGFFQSFEQAFTFG